MEGINKGNKNSSFDDTTGSERRRGGVTSEVEAGGCALQRELFGIVCLTKQKQEIGQTESIPIRSERTVRQSQNSFLIKEFKLNI